MSKKAKEYVRMYEEALNFHSDKFDEYAEASSYYEVSQEVNKGFSTKPWIYQINVPFATDAINLRVASLQANDYRGELEPLAPEDVENVSKLSKAYKWQWDDMGMNKVMNHSILQSAVLGEAYTHTIFYPDSIHGGTGRKNKGKLETYFLDAASVHIDPKALSLRTADYVCVTERTTREGVKRDYPDFILKEDEVDEFGNPQARGEIYTGFNYTSPQDSDVFTKVTIYEKNKKGEIEKTVILDGKILENTEKMSIRVFPIAQLVWQRRIKSPYGTSLMSMLLPMQKVLNEIESANANANMQYSSPSYVISEMSGIDPEAFAASAGAPSVVYQISSAVDIDKAVRPLMSDRGIDPGLVATKQELESSIYKLAGVTEQFKGTLGTSGNTASGADATVERAKVIEQMFLTNIEEYVEDISRIIIEFIVQGYAGDVLYPRGEKQVDGSYKFDKFEIPGDAGEMEFNFTINLNVRTRYSKEKQNRKLFELWQMERQYGDPNDVKAISTLDVLKTLNIPQEDYISQRFEEATKVDSEQKADLITELVVLAMDYGIDGQFLNEVIAEIVDNRMNTPLLDQFMQMIEQAEMQQEQDLIGGEQQFIDESAM